MLSGEIVKNVNFASLISWSSVFIDPKFSGVFTFVLLSSTKHKLGNKLVCFDECVDLPLSTSCRIRLMVCSSSSGNTSMHAIAVIKRGVLSQKRFRKKVYGSPPLIQRFQLFRTHFFQSLFSRPSTGKRKKPNGFF